MIDALSGTHKREAESYLSVALRSQDPAQAAFYLAAGQLQATLHMAECIDNLRLTIEEQGGGSI